MSHERRLWWNNSLGTAINNYNVCLCICHLQSTCNIAHSQPCAARTVPVHGLRHEIHDRDSGLHQNIAPLREPGLLSKVSIVEKCASSDLIALGRRKLIRPTIRRGLAVVKLLTWNKQTLDVWLYLLLFVWIIDWVVWDYSPTNLSGKEFLYSNMRRNMDQLFWINLILLLWG